MPEIKKVEMPKKVDGKKTSKKKKLKKILEDLQNSKTRSEGIPSDSSGKESTFDPSSGFNTVGQYNKWL